MPRWTVQWMNGTERRTGEVEAETAQEAWAVAVNKAEHAERVLCIDREPIRLPRRGRTAHN